MIRKLICGLLLFVPPICAQSVPQRDIPPIPFRFTYAPKPLREVLFADVPSANPVWFDPSFPVKVPDERVFLRDVVPPNPTDDEMAVLRRACKDPNRFDGAIYEFLRSDGSIVKYWLDGQACTISARTLEPEPRGFCANEIVEVQRAIGALGGHVNRSRLKAIRYGLR